MLHDGGIALAVDRDLWHHTVMVRIGGGRIAEVVLAEAIDIRAIVGVGGFGDSLAGFGVRLVLLGAEVRVPGRQRGGAVNPAAVHFGKTDGVVVRDGQRAGAFILVQFGQTHGGG